MWVSMHKKYGPAICLYLLRHSQKLYYIGLKSSISRERVGVRSWLTFTFQVTFQGNTIYSAVTPHSRGFVERVMVVSVKWWETFMKKRGVSVSQREVFFMTKQFPLQKPLCGSKYIVVNDNAFRTVNVIMQIVCVCERERFPCSLG